MASELGGGKFLSFSAAAAESINCPLREDYNEIHALKQTSQKASLDLDCGRHTNATCYATKRGFFSYRLFLPFEEEFLSRYRPVKIKSK